MQALALPAATDRTHEAVDALVAESIDGCSTHALGADLIEIRRAIDRLEAECLRRLHRFHHQHGALADGGLSTVSWLRRRCAMTVKAAAYRVHLARTLGELPATLDSARAGRASFSNVAMIAHLAGDVGVAPVAPLEGILVGAAETLEPAAMRTLTQATRLRLDPDGVLADDNHAHQRRWFECEQTYGGVFVLRGELDAEGGALVKTAIDALSHGMARGETRSASQRRGDALVDMSSTQLRCGDHRDVHGQRPHLTLTVSAEALRCRRRRRAGRAARGGSDPPGDRPAHRLRRGADGGHGRRAGRRSRLDGGERAPAAALGGTGHAHGPGTAAQRAPPPRPGLPLPGVRPPARVDRRPPHHPLVGWRSHRARQPDLPVPAAPPRGARAGVAHPDR